MEFKAKDYQSFIRDGISGRLTRGLVVSTDDPLFSGRVRVWIPQIHGGFYSTASESDDSESTVSSQVGTDRIGNLKDRTAIECLPWAPVMGHNWGPTSDLSSDVANSVFGVFNIPKVGTEVYIIFEDDNLDLPVIFGSVFHQGEMFQNSRIKSLELSPGLLISTEVTAASEKDSYPSRVSESYVVQSQKGSKLILSDLDGQEQIILGGEIGFFKKPYIRDDGDSSSLYSKYQSEYPNFPTTASAPFRIRTSVNADTKILDMAILTGDKNAVPAPPISTATQTAPTPVVASPVTVSKRIPIIGSWPKFAKGSYKDFRTMRSDTRIHLGIDLSVTKAKLVAPIQCKIMSFSRDTGNRSGAGNMLIVKGVDGYCHAFLHLDSINPEILSDISRGIYKTYNTGDFLGITGNTGGVEGASGGWHLHWEVFYSGDLVKLPSDAKPFREILRGKSTTKFKGVSIAGQNFSGTYKFVHPMGWLGESVDVSGVGTSIQIDPSQLSSFAAAYGSATETEYDKIIGLEISTTPGAEHIYLRHPSGGFAGFDADGNWKVYTPGNAEYKVNRTLVFDVLGGVITSCLAMYSRAKAVISQITPVTKPIQSNGDTFNSKNSWLPLIFHRIDQTRKKDMQDALKQSTSNIYYSLASNDLGKDIQQISVDGYASTFVPLDSDIRAYSNTEYDSIISESVKTFVDSKHALASVLTTKLFKSIMLVESNGNPNLNLGNSVGLFQITSSAIEDVTGESGARLESYYSPKENIKIGVQYFMKCVDRMLFNATTNKHTVTTDEDKRDILLASLMAYNKGITEISNLYKLTIGQSNTISYVALEERYIASSGFRNITLRYAPLVMYTMSKLS